MLADVNELPSLTLSQDLLRPKKLGMLKQILDEGTAMIFPVFALTPKLPAEETNRLARLLVSGESLRCGGDPLLPAWVPIYSLARLLASGDSAPSRLYKGDQGFLRKMLSHSPVTANHLHYLKVHCLNKSTAMIFPAFVPAPGLPAHEGSHPAEKRAQH